MKIVFAHNVYNRFLTLRDTILIERDCFPDSMTSVAYNSDLFINLFNDIENIKFSKFNEKPHKIGCVNGCILSIQQLLNEEFDVLVFSHDDVYIHNKNIVLENILDIINGNYDIICRTPDIDSWGGKYYMMENFYISKNSAVEIFSNLSILNNENEIPIDIHGKISPEVWLYNIFNLKKNKNKIISFELKTNDNYNSQLSKQMGFFHKNIGLRGWND